jgi:7,8-dihydropterin-6-yl-methyl-4-(beta-D-ribofuranosyl)aminobenzene 5'-phosphate synthase
VVQPDGNKLDYGELKRDDLEARGLKVVIAEEPTVVAGHAFTSGHIARITDFEMSPPAARLEAGAPGSACDATFHFPPGTVKMEAKPGEAVLAPAVACGLCLCLFPFQISNFQFEIPP